MGPIELRGPISNFPACIILQLDAQKRELAVCPMIRILTLPLRRGFILIGLGRLGFFAPIACVRDGFAVIMRGASQLHKALASNSGVGLYCIEELIL
jgi:hypothetical protein